MKIITIVYAPPGAESVAFIKYLCTIHPPGPSADHWILTSSPGAFPFGTPGFKIRPISDPAKQPDSNAYAFYAFLEAIKLAQQEGADYFFYYEIDCRFACLNWFVPIVTEFSRLMDYHSAPHNKILLAGSPVCWHPWAKGSAYSHKMQCFSAKVCHSTGLPMAMEGSHSGEWPHSLYPNGALAFYETAFVGMVFGKILFLQSEGAIMAEKLQAAIIKAHAFDLFIGEQFCILYGDEVFSHIVSLRSVYSGCGSHHVTMAERLKMVTGQENMKAAVHHIKTSELPLNAYINLVKSNEDHRTENPRLQWVDVAEPAKRAQG